MENFLITHRATTTLGDLVQTQRTYREGRLTREHIEITGPRELLDAPRRGSSRGKNWYRHEARPTRQIW